MKRYKKRTLALVLASVITVVGAFGAGNYKNSIMSLQFDSDSSGAVNVTVLTKQNYDNSIIPRKKDANTYVLTFPETNSEIAESPAISGNIKSVDVRTMPYTNDHTGYTIVTVKTYSDAVLTAKKALYIPTKDNQAAGNIAHNNSQENLYKEPIQSSYPEQQNDEQTYNPDLTSPEVQNDTAYQSEPVEQTIKTDETKVENVNKPTPAPKEETDPTEKFLLVLGMLFVITASVYFYIKGKNKITEIIGEQPDFDISEEKKEKQKKTKQIKNTIKRLDKMYSKPMRMPTLGKDFDDSTVNVKQNVLKHSTDEYGENTTVDLDALFQEKTKEMEKVGTEEILGEETDLLEEFLTDFSNEEFQRKKELELAEQHENLNNELFEKYTHSDKLFFTKDDIRRINALLNSEISDEAIKNINKYVVTDPIIQKANKEKAILENLITNYAVQQNVSFSREVVETLKKLISVELDSDFITDLRTNPERVILMQKEIESRNERSQKHSDILTLNVKDLLPDLSEALRKQGNKKIKSEVKKQVVYYSEGYDVSILSLKDKLPDLAAGFNVEENAYRPSDEVEYSVSGYDVETLKTDDTLPDLQEVKKHPELYREPENKQFELDEDALLKSIENVTFKPFDDGRGSFETVNEGDDEDAAVIDVKHEFEQFENFEIINDEPEIVESNAEQDGRDDFESLFNEDFYDLDQDKNKNATTSTETNEKENDAQELIKLIEAQQLEREKRRAEQQNVSKKQSFPTSKKEEPSFPEYCTLDGKKYNIVTASNFVGSMGCYLAKNDDGYSILGYIGEKVFKLKNYENLDSENLQTRASEKLADGTVRYIIKIGINKFILNVSKDKMEYVMDLC